LNTEHFASAQLERPIKPSPPIKMLRSHCFAPLALALVLVTVLACSALAHPAAAQACAASAAEAGDIAEPLCAAATAILVDTIAEFALRDRDAPDTDDAQPARPTAGAVTVPVDPTARPAVPEIPPSLLPASSPSTATALLSAFAHRTLCGLLAWLEATFTDIFACVASWLADASAVASLLQPLLRSSTADLTAHVRAFDAASVRALALRSLIHAYTNMPTRDKIAVVASRIGADGALIARALAEGALLLSGIANSNAEVAVGLAKNAAGVGAGCAQRAWAAACACVVDVWVSVSVCAVQTWTVASERAIDAWTGGSVIARDAAVAAYRAIDFWGQTCARLVYRSVAALESFVRWWTNVLYGGVQIGLSFEQATFDFIAYWSLISFRFFLVVAFVYSIRLLVAFLRLVMLQNPISSLVAADSLSSDATTRIINIQAAPGQQTQTLAPVCAPAPTQAAAPVTVLVPVHDLRRLPVVETSPNVARSETKKPAKSSSVTSASPASSLVAPHIDDLPEDDLSSEHSGDESYTPLYRRKAVISIPRDTASAPASRLPAGMQLKYEASPPPPMPGSSSGNRLSEDTAEKPKKRLIRRKSAIPKPTVRRPLRQPRPIPRNPGIIDITNGESN
jgi:hypothetical protein